MRRPELKLFSLPLLMLAAACQTQQLTGPKETDARPVGSRATMNASLDCRYSPSGTVVVPVGQVQSFTQSAGNCSGAYAALFPKDGQLGFGISTPCATFEVTEAGNILHTFKVRRCFSGTGTLAIYRNSTKSTLLQTIRIEDTF